MGIMRLGRASRLLPGRQRKSSLSSSGQSLDEPIQVLLAFEERLHGHALVLAVGAKVLDREAGLPYVGMPALRRKLPSVAPVDIDGVTGAPGQNRVLNASIAFMTSGLSGEGALDTCIQVGVNAI